MTRNKKGCIIGTDNLYKSELEQVNKKRACSATNTTSPSPITDRSYRAMNNSISKSEIFTAYNKARAAARRNGNNPKELERLNKALGILQSKAYYSGGDRDIYFPSASACGCKDWQFHTSTKRGYTGGCKHMMAEQLLQAITEARQPYDVTAIFESMIEQRENAEV